MKYGDIYRDPNDGETLMVVYVVGGEVWSLTVVESSVTNSLRPLGGIDWWTVDLMDRYYELQPENA